MSQIGIYLLCLVILCVALVIYYLLSEKQSSATLHKKRVQLENRISPPVTRFFCVFRLASGHHIEREVDINFYAHVQVGQQGMVWRRGKIVLAAHFESVRKQTITDETLRSSTPSTARPPWRRPPGGAAAAFDARANSRNARRRYWTRVR
jgi:hypothetical protein